MVMTAGDLRTVGDRKSHGSFLFRFFYIVKSSAITKKGIEMRDWRNLSFKFKASLGHIARP